MLVFVKIKCNANGIVRLLWFRIIYMNIIQERLLLNLLFKAKADAPLFVHLTSQMKNPNDMKNGASNAARWMKILTVIII